MSTTYLRVNMGIDWMSAATGLIGALIGGLCTLLGVKWQVDSSNTEQRKREEDHRKAILRALHDELETVSEVYKASIGSHIASLPKGQPFLFFWPVSSEYFAVYHSNSVFLGHLNDNDLRKSLIQTYTYAKALIDSFRLNNAFVEKYQQAMFIAGQAPSDAN